MRRLLSCVCLATLAVSAAGCKEEGTISVHKLEFKGIKAVDESRLKAALATKQSSKIPWGRKAFFDRSRFDADLKRIQAFYADRGYPDARVTGFDVKLNDKQDAVDIAVTVDEGQPVTVAAVDFQGFDVIPSDHLENLRKRIPMTVGMPRDRQEVVSAHEMALNELRDHGYPYARVNTDENDGGDGKHATVTFTAAPGPEAHFGSIDISGNQTVSDRVIARQLTFRPGDLYRRSIVQDAQRRLYSMELFQFVNIESLNPEQQGPTVDTRVTVAESKHQRVNFGIGYGTEEKGRVDGEYHHLNFFGGARTAGIHARYSSLDRGVRLDFNQPYFFSPHLSLGAEGQQWYTYTPAYNSIVTGGRLIVTHRWSAQSSIAFSGISERNDSVIAPEYLNDPTLYSDLIALGLDPTTGKQQGTLGALGIDLQHSTADNLLNARRGYQLAMHIEKAGLIIPGDFNYTGVSLDGRHYLPISDRLVWANRIQTGNIRPANDDPAEVPFSKKYFLGGAGSVRGWGRYEISPLSESGLPLGGNTLFAFSSEVRATLAGNLGGVLFLDGGNVWEQGWSIHFDDLRYAVGPGLRYRTPVGPIRFDFGYQLNPIPGLVVNGEPEKRHWRIHFSIGQAF
jgi:outer membrane protein assembly complex protein YaeT